MFGRRIRSLFALPCKMKKTAAFWARFGYKGVHAKAGTGVPLHGSEAPGGFRMPGLPHGVEVGRRLLPHMDGSFS